MASDEIDSGLDPAKEAAALRALEADTAGFLRRRLAFWAVRWTLGFAVIAVVVYFRPDWRGLWWAGICVAAIMPAIVLAAERLLKSRVRRLHRKLRDIEAALRDADES
jgi:hypothetical protein